MQYELLQNQCNSAAIENFSYFRWLSGASTLLKNNPQVRSGPNGMTCGF